LSIREGFKLYEQLCKEGMAIDRVMYVIIVSVSASLGDLEKTKDVQIYITRNDITTDIFLSSNLVDIYAKNGSMKLAYSAFL
jgi:hypothetical protein